MKSRTTLSSMPAAVCVIAMSRRSAKPASLPSGSPEWMQAWIRTTALPSAFGAFGSEGAGLRGNDQRQFSALPTEPEALELDRRRRMRETSGEGDRVVVIRCLAIIRALGVRTPLWRNCRHSVFEPQITRIELCNLWLEFGATRAALTAPAQVESAAGGTTNVHRSRKPTSDERTNAQDQDQDDGVQ